jgi:hypothetical protein
MDNLFGMDSIHAFEMHNNYFFPVGELNIWAEAERCQPL